MENTLVNIKQLACQYVNKLQTRWKQSPTARDITVVYTGDIISKILAVGANLILIRGLSISGYASYIAFINIGKLSASLIGDGINNALVRFSAEYLSRTGKKPYALYIFSVIIQILILLVILTLVILFPRQTARIILGNEEFANTVTIGMFLGIGTLLIEAGRSMLQAEEQYKRYIMILWLKDGGTLLIIGGFWIFGQLAYETIAQGLALLYLVLGVVVVGYGLHGIIKINSSWINSFKAESNLLREFISASGWLVAYSVTLAVLSRMDILMLSRYATRSELANYGVALQYYNLAMLLLTAIQAVLRTKFSKAEMQTTSRQQNFYRKWLKYSAWTGIFVLIFILFGKPVFVFLNGIEYERAFVVFSILSIGVWLSLMLSPMVNILIGRKEFKPLFGLGLVALFVGIVTNYIGIRMWGAVGAAIALVFTHNIILQGSILWRIQS